MARGRNSFLFFSFFSSFFDKSKEDFLPYRGFLNPSLYFPFVGLFGILVGYARDGRGAFGR